MKTGTISLTQIGKSQNLRIDPGFYLEDRYEAKRMTAWGVWDKELKKFFSDPIRTKGEASEKAEKESKIDRDWKKRILG